MLFNYVPYYIPLESKLLSIFFPKWNWWWNKKKIVDSSTEQVDVNNILRQIKNNGAVDEKNEETFWMTYFNHKKY